MAVSVADLAKYYDDNPPPKKDTLSDLEARLEALRAPDYRNPFKFDASLGIEPFGTSGPGSTYRAMAEALKRPAALDTSPLYRTYRVSSMGIPEPTPLSELLARNYKPSPTLFGAAKVAYGSGSSVVRVMEGLRPQLEKFGLFVGGLAATLERTLNALRSTRPLDPYGNPVPLDNMWLYSLARRAYQGDLEARVQFLDEIEADNPTDNPTYIEDLLRPTFAPTPQDLAGRREPWEQSSPEAARKWLRKQLRRKRLEQETPRNGKTEASDIEDVLQAPPHPDTTPELWTFYQNEIGMWREKAKDILTPKRYEVFLLIEQGLSPGEIADARGKAPGTIQKQIWEIRNDPQLRAMGEQLREELWWDRPAWDRS